MNTVGTNHSCVDACPVGTKEFEGMCISACSIITKESSSKCVSVSSDYDLLLDEEKFYYQYNPDFISYRVNPYILQNI